MKQQREKSVVYILMQLYKKAQIILKAKSNCKNTSVV